MINKKFNNKGSAFTIVIITMALSLIIISIISFRTNYQIKTNSKYYKDMQQKYLAESGIERVIAEISSGIESEISKAYPQNSISTYSDFQYSHEGHIPVNLEHNAIKDIGSNFVSSQVFNPLKDTGNKFLDMINALPNGDTLLKSEIKQLSDNTNQLADNINNKIGSQGEALIQNLGDYIHNNGITDRNDSRYQARVSAIGTYIDEKILEVSKIQQKLNELYNNNENIKGKIDDIQKKFESIKYNLEEIKCKLGIKTTESTVKKIINLDISSYTFPNDSTYELDGYEIKYDEDKTKKLNIPITINLKNNTISSIDAITVNNIISTGYKDNERYKMRASITFNIGKENNTYRVISYKVNEWKKI